MHRHTLHLAQSGDVLGVYDLNLNALLPASHSLFFFSAPSSDCNCSSLASHVGGPGHSHSPRHLCCGALQVRASCLTVTPMPSFARHPIIASHCRHLWYNKKLYAMPWNIPIEEVNFPVGTPQVNISVNEHRYSQTSYSSCRCRSGLLEWWRKQSKTSRESVSRTLGSQLELGAFKKIQAQYQVCQHVEASQLLQ